MKPKRVRMNKPTMVDLNYNCTLSRFAEQIGIKLWQAMCMMKYAEHKQGRLMTAFNMGHPPSKKEMIVFNKGLEAGKNINQRELDEWLYHMAYFTDEDVPTPKGVSDWMMEHLKKKE